MPPRRVAHKIAHAKCPWGKTSWAACDSCESQRYGRCRWLVGKREPEQCSHWATGPEGTCGQHYAFERDRAIKAERIAMRQAAMNLRADNYIAWVLAHPSIFEKMVAAGEGLEPPTERVTTASSTTELPRKKGPHRLTSTD